ncbi:unnamed protein product [Durusdinium trenchii]|uniref:Uncharacterized protein n=1 Tax=Durusdinium trenchii TaxID=1381693 RepID=A0ABP0M648_9DINO
MKRFVADDMGDKSVKDIKEFMCQWCNENFTNLRIITQELKVFVGDDEQDDNEVIATGQHVKVVYEDFRVGLSRALDGIPNCDEANKDEYEQSIDSLEVTGNTTLQELADIHNHFGDKLYFTMCANPASDDESSDEESVPETTTQVPDDALTEADTVPTTVADANEPEDEPVTGAVTLSYGDGVTKEIDISAVKTLGQFRKKCEEVTKISGNDFRFKIGDVEVFQKNAIHLKTGIRAGMTALSDTIRVAVEKADVSGIDGLRYLIDNCSSDAFLGEAMDATDRKKSKTNSVDVRVHKFAKSILGEKMQKLLEQKGNVEMSIESCCTAVHFIFTKTCSEIENFDLSSVRSMVDKRKSFLAGQSARPSASADTGVDAVTNALRDTRMAD